MADIDIERKRPIWPWILGALILALLLWALIALFTGDERREAAPVTPVDTLPPGATVPPVGAIPPEVDEYLTFTRTPEPAQEMGRQHEYTAGGIRRLADALEALVAGDTVGDTAIEPRLQEFRQRADRLQETDWNSPQHADIARGAFTSAGELMETIRTNRYPDVAELQGQVNQVQGAAGELRTDQPLLEQAERVQAFFDRAGEVLRTMSRTPAAGPGRV